MLFIDTSRATEIESNPMTSASASSMEGNESEALPTMQRRFSRRFQILPVLWNHAGRNGAKYCRSITGSSDINTSSRTNITN